jgi:hypothetical protein
MIREYVSITTANALLDMVFMGSGMRPTVCGYSKNLGAPKNLNGRFIREEPISITYSGFSPFTATEGRLTLAAEMENPGRLMEKFRKMAVWIIRKQFLTPVSCEPPLQILILTGATNGHPSG